MRTAWRAILVLLIETILVTGCVTGNVEKRYNKNGAVLQLPPNENFVSTEATVIMTAFIGEPTDEIVFHIDNITIVSCEVSNRIDRSIGPYDKTHDPMTGKYKMSFNSTLSAGQSMTIAMKYRGVLRGDMTALYRSLESVEKHNLPQREDRYGIVGIGIFGAARYLSIEQSAGNDRAYVKDYCAEFGTNAESSEQSALELAKYEFKCYDDNENHIIEWMRNDQPMPNTPAVSTRATEMTVIDTSNTTDYRLPDYLVPSTYSLDIKLDDETSFQGKVTILADVKKNTATIVLHVNEIEVHSVYVRQDGRLLDVADTAEISQYNFFVINLRQTLTIGFVSIEIEYTGKFNGAMEGFYRETYLDDTGKTRWFAATQFAPIGARRMFPCLDEPRFTVLFHFSINRPPNWKVMCSAQLLSSRPHGFRMHYRMSTYTFSLVVGDFDNLVDFQSRYKISATPNVIKHGKYALDITFHWKSYYNILFKHNDDLAYLYERYDAEFVIEQLHAALESDARNTTHPMTHEVYSPAEISRTFDDIISTAKSASVLRMIEKTFGVPVFHETLRKYRGLWFDGMEPDHLFEVLQEAIDESDAKLQMRIKPIMDSWTKLAGYPIVSVRIKGRVAYLEQKRFYSISHEADTSNNDTWWIPVTWASESKANFTTTSPQYWLREKHGTVRLNASNEWVIFNVQQSGYYRVNYDSASWERIIKALKSGDRIRIHEINRAAIINDLLILGQAGQIDYATVLSATQYLINETDYIPWRAAFDSLAYINRQITDENLFEQYKTHVRTILNPIYEKLGFTEFNGEKLHDTLLRVHVVDWACQFNVTSCISWSLEKFAAWKLDSIAVPVDFRKTVYCTAMKYGAFDDWNFLWKRYALTSSAMGKVVILDGLGCSQDRKNLERLLSSAITKHSGIRFEDSLRAFSAVYSSSSIGTEYALEFVAENLMMMFKYYQDKSSIDSILNGISSALATEQLLLKMEVFVERQRKILASIGLSPEKYLKTVYETASWHEKYSSAIHEWLEKTYPSFDYRLPTKVYPRSYDIYLAVYLNERQFFFHGQVIIQMDIIADTYSIVLHANGLALRGFIAFIDSTKFLGISTYTIDKVTDQLTIYLTTKVVAGAKLTLHIAYSGHSSIDSYGFYRSSYIDELGKTRWLVSTQFRPVHARRAFPCFDEPAFKATFAIHIERPNDYQTLSNMRLLSSVPSSSSDRTWDLYERSVPISSYLVAFVISDFESLDNISSNYRVWAPPGTAKYGEYALDVCEKVLSFLGQYTGIDNPMEKIDLIGIPNFQAETVANWGLMTFRDDGLLGNENVTSASLMKYLVTQVARGTAYTWFGNLVTCDWWDHVWLHEGLADYFQWIAGHQVSPRWKLLQQFVVYEMHPAMVRDALSPQPLWNSKVNESSDVLSDHVHYGKHASVIRMIHHALGKRTFKSALRTYLEKRKWKTATPEHFLSAIQLHTEFGARIKSIIESWIDNKGYPVVNASWDADVLTLTQEQFVYVRSTMTRKKQMGNRFWIPITITTKSKSNFGKTRPLFWFDTTRNITLILKKDEWFIINIQETGFYRVNYDVHSWERIIAGLMSDDFDGIHEINRAQIIDDLFNLARADYVAYDLALSASTYLVNEDNHLPWAAFFEAMHFLYRRFQKHDVRPALDRFVKGLIKQVYGKVGFLDLADEQHMDRLNREIILRWACRLDKTSCGPVAVKLYNEWRKSGINGISQNSKPAVYCTSIELGGRDNWKFLWNEYAQTKLGSEKVIILEALACARNPKALLKYLKDAISREKFIRDQDIPEIFNAVLHADLIGVDVMLEFLQLNYNKLRSHYGGWNGVANLIHRVASEISNQDQLRKLELFIRKRQKDLDEIKPSLLSAIDTAKTNLEWIHAREANINAALTQAIESMNRREEKNSGPTLPSSSFLVTVVFCLVFAH